MHKDRSVLTDAQWERLSPRLPGQAQSPGTTARDTRPFVAAVRGRARCGVLWRVYPPNGLARGTRYVPGFGAGAKLACGRGRWSRC